MFKFNSASRRAARNRRATTPSPAVGSQSMEAIRSRMASSSGASTSSHFGDPKNQDRVNVNVGPALSEEGSLLSVESDATHTIGGGFGVLNGNISGGISSQDGVHGQIGGNTLQAQGRWGTDLDPAQATVSGQTTYAGANGFAGPRGVGAGVELGLGEIAGDVRVGEEGGHTSTDLSLTGGIAAGAGGRLSGGLNFGRDTDGDGIPNYGFSLSGMFGLGASVGVNVEQPGQQALSLVDSIFGTSWSSLRPDPTPTQMEGMQVGGLLGSGPTTAQGAAAPYGNDSDGEYGGISTTATAAAGTYSNGDLGGEFGGLGGVISASSVSSAPARSPIRSTAPSVTTATGSVHNSDSDSDSGGFDYNHGAQDVADEYAGGNRSGGEFDTSSSSSSGGSSGGGGCFLTTAACEHRGLPDDCHALTVLRRFRDEHMLATPAGRERVLTYYRIAPRIVAGVSASADSAGVWESLWTEWILPSVAAVEAGENALADDLYSSMVRMLTDRWLDEESDAEEPGAVLPTDGDRDGS